MFPSGRLTVDAVLPEGKGDAMKALPDLAGPEGIEPPTRGLGVPWRGRKRPQVDDVPRVVRDALFTLANRVCKPSKSD